MSPGEAASIADWIVVFAENTVGFFPPTVTVTASMDCCLRRRITSSPQRAGVVPAGTFSSSIEQVEFPDGITGTLTVLSRSRSPQQWSSRRR